MPTQRPELRRLGLRFLLLLLASAAVWWLLLAPLYERALTAVSIALLHAIEPEAMTGTARVVTPFVIISHTEAFRDLRVQWLDLPTIHANVPLLVALFLVTPGASWGRRLAALSGAALALAISHVLHFLLSVQWLYALENVGPYRVIELDYLARGFWSSLDHHGQTAKYLIVPILDFYSRIGRLCLPIVLWMIFAVRVRQSDRHSDRPRAPAAGTSCRHLPA